MDNRNEKATPIAVNIPKSRIIVRYEPNMNDTKPMAVVIAAKKTGKTIYDKALIIAFSGSLSCV